VSVIFHFLVGYLSIFVMSSILWFMFFGYSSVTRYEVYFNTSHFKVTWAILQPWTFFRLPWVTTSSCKSSLVHSIIVSTLKQDQIIIFPLLHVSE
jgi:hypothetical protein